MNLKGLIKSNISRWPLILITLSLTYCVWTLDAPSRLISLPDDEKVGKTLLVQHSAGKIGFFYSWYWGKEPRDSYFSQSWVDPNSYKPPVLYKVTGTYHMDRPGISFGQPINQYYLIKPIKEISDRRIFFPAYIECDKKTDLFDEETGTKIDFVCEKQKY